MNILKAQTNFLWGTKERSLIFSTWNARQSQAIGVADREQWELCSIITALLTYDFYGIYATNVQYIDIYEEYRDTINSLDKRSGVFLFVFASLVLLLEWQTRFV